MSTVKEPGRPSRASDAAGGLHNCDFFTADLFACARSGDAQSLCRLLNDRRELRLHLDECDDSERTPLYVACRAGHTEAARVLIMAGATVDRSKDAGGAQGVTALHAASHFGHVKTVSLLVDADASMDMPSEKGTPLFIACQRGHLPVAKLLVASRCQVDLADEIDGATPLLIACQEKQTEAVRVLLEAGADVDRASLQGVTPLFLACEDGNLALAAVLSEYGASRHGPRKDPWTAESVAGSHGHTALVEWLRRSATWSTPLHHIAHLHPRRARDLLRAGSALHARPSVGTLSPLELAIPLAAGKGSECGLCRARERAFAEQSALDESWVRCSEKFAGRPCRAARDCSNRKCGFDHPRDWPHLKVPPPPPPPSLPLPLPAGGVCDECAAREAARLVVAAAGAWCPGTHALWPDSSRARAVELVRLGWLLSRVQDSPGPFAAEEQALMDVWRAYIIPPLVGERA